MSKIIFNQVFDTWKRLLWLGNGMGEKVWQTCQRRHTTTSCWCAQRGRGGIGFACGTSLCRTSSPGTCWHRYAQLQAPKNNNSNMTVINVKTVNSSHIHTVTCIVLLNGCAIQHSYSDLHVDTPSVAEWLCNTVWQWVCFCKSCSFIHVENGSFIRFSRMFEIRLTSELSCSYSSDTMCTHRGNSSTSAFFRPKS